jgi:hypothetical protein
MSQVLRAFTEMFIEGLSGVAFQDVRLVPTDCVPVLWFAVMQVIRRIEIQILLMPSEKRLPGTLICKITEKFRYRCTSKAR